MSVTRRYCTKTAKSRITQTTPYDNQWTLSLLMPKISAKFQCVTPNGGAKQRWGRFKLAIFDKYLAILQKRYKRGTYGYYGTLIETRMRSIEWRYLLYIFS